MTRAPSLFEADRLTMADSLELTAQSLRAYGERYRHWVVAYSGGKDSSATVTAIAALQAWASRQPRSRRPTAVKKRRRSMRELAASHARWRAEELARITQLIEHETWPDGWDGTEVRGDVMLDQVLGDGIVQSLLLEVS